MPPILKKPIAGFATSCLTGLDAAELSVASVIRFIYLINNDRFAQARILTVWRIRLILILIGLLIKIIPDSMTEALF